MLNFLQVQQRLLNKVSFGDFYSQTYKPLSNNMFFEDTVGIRFCRIILTLSLENHFAIAPRVSIT